jgi:hypothetical protein
VPKVPDSFFLSGEAGGYSPTFSDVSFQNERAMWWAEFDSVGEEVVRGYVERNSYTPTGMEIARQWLARREFLQLREDVQSIRALAERAQETVSDSLSASDVLALTSQVDANSRAIAEIAATAKKNTRTMVLVGMTASLFALCAIVMVLASSRPSSRQVAPNAKQASAQPSRAKQAAVQLPPPAVPPAETRQALPLGRAPAAPPENASAIPPENVQKEQPSNAPQINSPDLKPEGQSLAEALALIADKMGGEGTISFTAQFHDAATGRDHTELLSYKASNVTIDPNRCQVGYHWHVEQNGRALSDQDRTVELRVAKSVRVASIDAESGRRFSMRADPKVYVVHIARWDNVSGDILYFHDKDMAARVATATRHAVKLCDNGERQFPRR